MTDALVSPEWSSAHLGDPDIVVLDCTASTVPRSESEGGGFRGVSGRGDYDVGHIPSAGFADLTTDLANPESGFEFAWPTAEAFCASMGALGVGDDSRVILYDGNGSMWATRVWWMLRWVGFDNAFVLDGGLKLWVAEGHALTIELAAPVERVLTPRTRPRLIANRDEVFAAVTDHTIALFDALSEAHFRGDESSVARPGHIPRSLNVPARNLLDESGRFRPIEELEAMFPGAKNARAIAYCGDGVAGSSDAFTMIRLGFTDVAVYAASLQEWAADPTNPMEIGGA
jgi:thiosulfate/3-mercaptopyruvate sulfurtransferase